MSDVSAFIIYRTWTIRDPDPRHDCDPDTDSQMRAVSHLYAPAQCFFEIDIATAAAIASTLNAHFYQAPEKFDYRLLPDVGPTKPVGTTRFGCVAVSRFYSTIIEENRERIAQLRSVELSTPADQIAYALHVQTVDIAKHFGAMPTKVVNDGDVMPVEHDHLHVQQDGQNAANSKPALHKPIETIMNNTRPVSLAHAAREWFDMDKRTLKKSIESGDIHAEQISERLWRFDIDQLTVLGAEADADPEKTGD